MSLTIRPAVRADVPGTVDLAARAFPLACPPGLSRDAIDAFIGEHLDERAFRGYLTDPTHVLLVGVDSVGSVAAYALLIDGTAMDETCAGSVTGRPTIGVSKFYLDAGLHGSGAAEELLGGVLSHARVRGASSVWLATNEANARARAFYLKNGFVERGHRVFTVGGVGNDDTVLELPLRPHPDMR